MKKFEKHEYQSLRQIILSNPELHKYNFTALEYLCAFWITHTT